MIWLDGIPLSGIVWINRYNWTPVKQELSYAVDGTLIVQEGKVKSGRLIILQSPGGSCWVTKATMDSLMELVADAGRVMTLTVGNETFNVMFYHADGSPIEAVHLFPIEAGYEQNDTMFCINEIKLVEVPS